MYTDTWSINGSAGPQSLSQPGLRLSAYAITTDMDYLPHTVYCKNTHATVAIYVGAQSPSGGPLNSVGWKLSPGESFQIRLSRDQLWVAAPSGSTGQVTFIVAAE
jgi:hypothetical protein